MADVKPQRQPKPSSKKDDQAIDAPKRQPTDDERQLTEVSEGLPGYTD